MRFTKMHGLGNDYVYVDLFRERLSHNPSDVARAVSNRNFGIGSDGLILIGPSDHADARMRMFNADGSESEMCGNGVRCVAKYVHDHGIAPKDRVTIETGRGVLTLDLEVIEGKAQKVRVDMGAPILISNEIPTTLPGDPPVNASLVIEGSEFHVTCVSMGNPHAVIYVKDAAEFPLETLGPRFENHPVFPRRVNLHVVQVLSHHEAIMRTWERGSGITMACGTGACSVCVAGVLTGKTGAKLLAHLPGGDLELEWAGQGHPVFMTGPATEVYSGEWHG